MQHLRPSSASSAARTLQPSAVVLVALALGIAAERAAFEWSDVRHWLPDLVVGVAFAVAAAYTWNQRRGTALLFASTGYSWFLGNFSADFLYVHRGVLVHLLVTYPGWRPRSQPLLATVACGYVIAFVTPVWQSDALGSVLSLAVLAFVVADFTSARGRRRRDRRVAARAAAVFTMAVAGGALVRDAFPSGDAVEPMLLAYDAAMCAIALALASGLRRPDTATVADLVVELGESRLGALQEALAAALGDPTLRVGYWADGGGYIDASGSPVAVPDIDMARSTTFVDRDSKPFAVLVHDPAVLDEPALIGAVATATRLSAANAALNDEVRNQLAELTASRRRLVVAADAERRRLGTRLRAGVEHRVLALARTVGDAAKHSTAASDEHLHRASGHLEHTISDLGRLAQGLHPSELEGGLVSAIAALVERSPIDVDVVVDADNLPSDEVATAAYFVCVEALANVAKHAGAEHASIHISSDSTVLSAVIADDGCGGADVAGGSGLRGLEDRVEALGGTLTMTSPLAGGTRLGVELPLDPHA